jgi:hypothetical protein
MIVHFLYEKMHSINSNNKLFIFFSPLFLPIPVNLCKENVKVKN